MGNIIRDVKSHEFRVSNSFLATKFTLLRLSCGHYANWSRPGHDANNLPVTAECPTCGDIQALRCELKGLIDSGVISYTRACPSYDQCGNTRYYTVNVYKRDKTSPSGVLLAMSCADIPEFSDLLRGVYAPLSPTER
jgi:hypothetical protein